MIGVPVPPQTFCKQVSAKMQALPEGSSLASLKLDLLRVVCSHEHFVTLNLPFGTPLTPSPPASPCPSIASSQGSAVSGSTLTDRSAFAELSPEYRQQHFLLGLLLSDLATVLHTRCPPLPQLSIRYLFGRRLDGTLSTIVSMKGQG